MNLYGEKLSEIFLYVSSLATKGLNLIGTNNSKEFLTVYKYNIYKHLYYIINMFLHY